MLGGGGAGGVLRFKVVASQCLNEGVCALSALFTADDTMLGSYVGVPKGMHMAGARTCNSSH